MLGQDLGGIVGVAVDLLDRGGDALVEPGPAQARQVVDHHLPDEGVHEAEAAASIGVVDQQALHEGVLEVVEAVVDVAARRPGEQVERDVAADHRRHLEQLQHVPAPPAAERVDRLRLLAHRGGPGVPVLLDAHVAEHLRLIGDRHVPYVVRRRLCGL